MRHASSFAGNVRMRPGSRRRATVFTIFRAACRSDANPGVSLQNFETRGRFFGRWLSSDGEQSFFGDEISEESYAGGLLHWIAARASADRVLFLQSRDRWRFEMVSRRTCYCIYNFIPKSPGDIRLLLLARPQNYVPSVLE